MNIDASVIEVECINCGCRFDVPGVSRHEFQSLRAVVLALREACADAEDVLDAARRTPARTRVLAQLREALAASAPTSTKEQS